MIRPWPATERPPKEADPVWCQAQAQLQEAVQSNSKGGRPPKGETAAHRAAVKDPTLSEADRKPTDRKSRLIRTLTNLKEDPEACKAKGTTPEKVQGALRR